MNYTEVLKKALEGKNLREISFFSGIREATIKNWLDGKSSPTLVNFAAVINTCGYQLEYKLSC